MLLLLIQAGQASQTGQTSQAGHVGVGDTVKILDDAETVKQLQTGHGGWINDMKAVITLHYMLQSSC